LRVAFFLDFFLLHQAGGLGDAQGCAMPRMVASPPCWGSRNP
jgi:hypothetical protein